MSRSFGAVMYQCNFPSWNKVLSQINEEDLYIDESDSIFGYEYEPHLTLVYGFHGDINHQNIIRDISKFPKVELKLNKVSSFKSDKFDVLKIDVECEKLLNLRNTLLKKYDNSQDYDEYNPHITIAYLKKGVADKYHNNSYIGTIVCDEIKYSSPKGHNIYINL